MRYPVPQQPSTSKEVDALVKSIDRYQNGSTQMREKLGKMKSMQRKINEELRRHEILVVTTKEDAAHATEKLNFIKQRLRDFDLQMLSKGKAFKNDMFALEELKEGIQKQTEEVRERISGLTSACQDWKFANQLNNDICSSARAHAYGSFYRWSLIQPLLRIWMATDSQIHRTTYATAHFEGVYEELMAHFEVKDSIEQFGEDHYAVYKETEDLVRTVKQATEERHMRSLLLDQQHVTASRKLQKLVNSCKVLKREIEQREMLRFKLNGLMMELSNALETDLRSATEVCEKEATKPASVTVADLHQALETGALANLQAAGSTGSGGTGIGSAKAADGNNVAGADTLTTPLGKTGSGKGKTFTSPGKDVAEHTEKNTALNSVSKLPLLIKKPSETSHHSAGSDSTAEHSTSSGATGNTGGSTSGSTNNNYPAERHADHATAGNVYAQLPQYDANAISYVRSFNAPKRTKTWRWCKNSAHEVNKMVQGMYPVVQGPVELEIRSSAPASASLPNSNKSSAKTPAVPSFRRRVGHSSKNPFAGTVAGGVPNYFARERASVGSAGMPIGWLKPPAAEGETDVGSADRAASPTGNAEDERKRALKFMLSDRETHYDLLQREVVDAVTMQQMDQARLAAAARRKAEAEAAESDPETRAQAELENHQYRTHLLLKEDYSSKMGLADDEEEKESEEYSLYVSLPEMSAHSALTARQAVRNMQTASAGITFETISKISEVLQEATDVAMTTRAGTAVDARRGSLGLQGRSSPPHSPGSLVAHSPGGAPSAHRMNFRQFSNTLGNSAASSRARFATTDDTLEGQTAAALDSFPVEAQAQDLNEKVAVQFRAAREKVEDWIETHVQCNYKSTKRSLIELISNLELGLDTGDDGDSDGFGFSDHEASLVEGGHGGFEGARSGSAMMAYGPGSMNFTLKNMLEMSKNLIGSIQQNLKEFAQRQDTMTPDYIGDHRRPNSGGLLSSMAFTSTAEEVYIEADEEEERPFDPDDYAFNRSRVGSPRSPEKLGMGNTMGSARGPGSPSRSGKLALSPSQINHSNLAALLQQYGQMSNTGWPAKRCVLHSMESIICGELFVMDYIWVPQKMNTELVAKLYVTKTEYREYKFTVTPHMISDLTNTPRDLALHTLFHDTAKVTQAIIGSLTKETVDPRFYSEIVRSFRHSAGEEFQPNWPPMVLEEMIHPQNILNRRGSIGQIYRPGSSEKNRLSTPEMRMNKRMAEATEEEAAAANQPREYEYLMHILTVRKKQGELLSYSFPTSHAIAPEVFNVNAASL